MDLCPVTLGHLWFSGRQKLSVPGLNWNPWDICWCSKHLSQCVWKTSSWKISSQNFTSLGKTLPLAWLIHNTMHHHKQFFVILLFKKKLHENLLCWFEKQSFSSVFKCFLTFFTINPCGTFSIKDNMY